MNATADIRLTHQAAAAYVANKVHDQALTTSNPAQTLDDILSTLDDSMPEAFATMGTAPDLAKVLQPGVTHRLIAFRDIERARATDTCGFGYVLDILTASIRDGAEPGAVFDRSLVLFEQVRAEAGR